MTKATQQLIDKLKAAARQLDEVEHDSYVEYLRGGLYGASMDLEYDERELISEVERVTNAANEVLVKLTGGYLPFGVHSKVDEKLAKYKERCTFASQMVRRVEVFVESRNDS